MHSKVPVPAGAVAGQMMRIPIPAETPTAPVSPMASSSSSSFSTMVAVEDHLRHDSIPVAVAVGSDGWDLQRQASAPSYDDADDIDDDLPVMYMHTFICVFHIQWIPIRQILVLFFINYALQYIQ
jgi:hypothetical protein